MNQEMDKLQALLQEFDVPDAPLQDSPALYSAQVSKDKDSHCSISAWFLGPRAENTGELLYLIFNAIMEHKKTRKLIYPKDPPVSF
jgi:hypothetical protein